MQARPARRHATRPRPLWITDRKVARLLGVHRSTVWRWLDRGLLPPPRRVGGRTVWLRADVRLFARCGSLAEFRRRKARQVDG